MSIRDDLNFSRETVLEDLRSVSAQCYYHSITLEGVDKDLRDVELALEIYEAELSERLEGEYRKTGSSTESGCSRYIKQKVPLDAKYQELRKVISLTRYRRNVVRAARDGFAMKGDMLRSFISYLKKEVESL